MTHQRFDSGRAAGRILARTLLAGALLFASSAFAQSGASENVTWNCTGSPCPWGQSLGNPALVWPDDVGATRIRHGYTTTRPIYLPAARANGATIWVDSGSANVFAGTPSASSHRWLATVNVGEFYEISGLAADEVLSVQNDYSAFSYQIDLPEPLPPQEPEEPGPDPDPQPAAHLVTWNCTGSPCPWGSSLGGYALVWPNDVGATSVRHGYTTTEPVYLPSTRANGATIWIDSGSANLFAGTPGAASHRFIATVNAGEHFEVSGVAAGEVFSVQNDYNSFTYQIELPAAPPDDPEEPGTQDPPGSTGSEVVTWSCTGYPCPWGDSLTADAIVWPTAAQPFNTRHGYTTSKGVYLPAAEANGTQIWIDAGTATVYAGTPGAASHRVLATLTAGNSYTVAGAVTGEGVSVQSDSHFAYRFTLGQLPEEPEEPGVIHADLATWRCNTPGCTDDNWYGAVINWPSWAAYHNNNRAGDQSRSVFSQATNQPLYPYMGAWANGCQVEVKSGTVLIIEWQRGTDEWRETWLNPGETHTISLQSGEDGAMIEAEDYSPGFSVKLTNCTPQPVQ
jgi:hypothetical protein